VVRSVYVNDLKQHCNSFIYYEGDAHRWKALSIGMDETLGLAIARENIVF